VAILTVWSLEHWMGVEKKKYSRLFSAHILTGLFSVSRGLSLKFCLPAAELDAVPFSAV